MVGIPKLTDEAVVWTVRIHEVDGVTRDHVTSFFSRMDGAYLVVREADASRPHYQGWAISRLKEVTLRLRIKTAFPDLVGNKGYSLVACREPEKYMKYVLKGTRESPPDVVCVSGVEYTEEWRSAQHDAFWAAEVSTAYEAKKAKLSAVEKVWAIVATLDKVTPRRVGAIIIKVFSDAGKPFDVFQVKRLTTTIMCRYDPEFRKIVLQTMLKDDMFDAYEVRETISHDYDIEPWL